MIKQAIGKVVDGVNLTREEMVVCMGEIMTGRATSAQIASFITALRLKGETVDEITGASMVMREKAVKINVGGDTVIDTCGTGGSNTGSFNISTAAGFVVSGAGLKVAKHGNRAVSSQCGSADVLKALGVNIDIAPNKVETCIKEVGIGFLFAPLFHGAMKYAIDPRREIGIRTIFNILGPLTNPAGANCQVLGVYRKELTEVMASVLKNLGERHSFVVHGLDGLDEITITGKTQVSELKDGKIKTFCVKPQDFKIKVARLEDIKGGSAEDNARIIKEVLKGVSGAKQDVVLLNASSALVAGGLAQDFKKGIELTRESIASGRAMEKLEKLIVFTNK
ncbi:MAG: anthranilate phosphoribosyltransferase [Candidatus Gorgyraea atricola]|nr:anthranilate phosphoribosyltransferase [Candidatus Gorgyraea atricola]